VCAELVGVGTGLLTGVSSGNTGFVASFGYSYDTLGKLLSRSNSNTGMRETFGYDSLNRLTSTSVNLSPTPLNKNFTYDLVGNMTSKSDVGTYSYPSPDSRCRTELPPRLAKLLRDVLITADCFDPLGKTGPGCSANTP